jgi:hypothetical protein
VSSTREILFNPENPVNPVFKCAVEKLRETVTCSGAHAFLFLTGFTGLSGLNRIPYRALGKLIPSREETSHIPPVLLFILSAKSAASPPI